MQLAADEDGAPESELARHLPQLYTSTVNSRHRALSLALQGRRVNHDRYAVLAFVTNG